MDKITLQRIELLHPALRDEAKEIYAEICERLTGKALCRFSHTLRTFAEQDALYAQGRTAPGKIVTRAKGGQSWHNYGMAIDIVLLVDTDGNGSYESASWDTTTDFDNDNNPDWDEVVYVFGLYGWEWGGNWKFKDTPHFQKTFGLTISEAKKRYDNKQVISGTNYIKL
jgi:peptidoglycan L-alanyl-D-glutamate endopeptidase CwlK